MQLNYVNCNLCNQDNADLLEQDGPYSVIRCNGCGLVYINPQPDKKMLFEHYNRQYYQPWLGEQLSVRKNMWRRRFNKIRRFKQTGKILDVGCGSGLFLNEAKNNGWQVWGTEVSGYAVNHIKENFSIEVFQGELQEAHFVDNFFDVVTLWHVLEHTHDPLGNLIEVRRVLKPQGVAVIAVPSIRNYIYKIAFMLVKRKRPKIFSAQDREIHLYHFSSDTLKKMLKKSGLVPVGFAIDKEQARLGFRITNSIAQVIYQVFRLNLGLAFEVHARKS